MDAILEELRKYSHEDRMHQAAAYLRYCEGRARESVSLSPEFVREVAQLLDGAASRLDREAA